jgi:hypothetical protein
VERRASLYGNMPKACTIKVHFDAALTRIVRDTDDFVLRKDRSIKSILQRYYFSAAAAKSLVRIGYQGGSVQMDVLFQDDEILNVLKGEVMPLVLKLVGVMAEMYALTIGRNYRNDLSAGVKGNATCLVRIDMGAMVTENRIRRLLEVCPYAQLIRHCTGGNKQRGFLPK